MTVRSQLRSYLSWPTDALVPGPTWIRERVGAWALSFVLGLGLALASCQTTGRALFVVNRNDNIFGICLIVGATLFVPLVLASFLLPRIGGPLLVLCGGVIAVCSFPASGFRLVPALGVALAVGGPMLLVGAGFTWSGLKPEAA